MIPTPYFDQRITRKICDCGKECKNPRGLKIHQAKMKCMDERGHILRTFLLPGETKEVHGQDSHHCVKSLHAIDRTTPCRVNYKQSSGLQQSAIVNGFSSTKTLAKLSEHQKATLIGG